MTRLTASLDGIGLLGPGLQNWPQTRSILRGEAIYLSCRTQLPAPQTLPAAERRRATAAVKLTLATGLEAVAAAGMQAAHLATVFTSSGSDGLNCHEICAALACSDRMISPTRFHNSVHNAASGYWGIATGAMAPSTVLCALDASFGVGLLEALVQVAVLQQPVLLLAYDTGYPEPLHSVRPIPDSFGLALALTPKRSDRSLARLSIRAAAPFTDDPANTLTNADLDALRRSIPAARALPLLEALSRGESGTVVLDHLPGQGLAVTIDPS
ncbi:beta-ketoacyl synthase chain length factor [Thiomonas intermedia]|uniref:beta-ketoacyl synthase chain length factor n=1 Tax=Thiomonas intermedia TaxID=926 RepID=UPI0009A55035|nr:beta-ketoacyl synthase chain length factor [Thiomonas intermedia]